MITSVYLHAPNYTGKPNGDVSKWGVRFSPYSSHFGTKNGHFILKHIQINSPITIEHGPVAASEHPSIRCEATMAKHQLHKLLIKAWSSVDHRPELVRQLFESMRLVPNRQHGTGSPWEKNSQKRSRYICNGSVKTLVTISYLLGWFDTIWLMIPQLSSI